jgi:hypothetical protein
MDKSGSEEGFMPRGKQFGYIFTGEKSVGGDNHTIAHELGHGRWKLRHTFDSAYGSVFGEKETDNLMSYSGGVHIAKWQWDEINDPAWVALFDSDEDGMSVAVRNLPEDFQNTDGTFTFITPAGEYITLPKEVRTVVFQHGIIDWTDYKNLVTGTLIEFLYDGTAYKYNFSGNNLAGYFNAKDNTKWNDKNESTYTNPDGYIMGLPTKDKYVLYKFDNTQTLNKYSGSTKPILSEADFPFNVFGNVNAIKRAAYSYPNDVLANNQYRISEYETSYLGNHQEKSEHLLVSKISQIQSMYPDLFLKFCAHFDKWDNPVLLSKGEWDNKVVNDETLKTKWKSDPKAFYIEMLEALKAFIDNKRNSLKDYIAEYDSKYNPAHPYAQIDLRNNITSLINTLSASDLASVDAETRFKALSVEIGAGEGDEMREAKEQAIIKLLETTPGIDVDKMLSNMLDAALYTPSKTSSLKLLTKGIDDKILFVGNDNYKKFILTLVKLSYKSTNFQSKLNPEINDQYIFTHSYSSIYNRIYTSLLGSDGQRKEDMSVSLDKDGKNVVIEWRYIQGFSEQSALDLDPNPYAGSGTRLEPIWSKTETYTLTPFDPVVYIKNNDLGMLVDFKFNDKDGNILPVPAIALLYANDKAGNQTASDVVMLTADAVGLATGVGELATGVNGLRKVWAVSDMINSGINLTANGTGLANNTAVQPYLAAYDLITLLSIGGRIGGHVATSAVKGAKDLNAFDVQSLAKEINNTTFDISKVSTDNLANYKKLFTRAQKEAGIRNMDNIEITKALAKLGSSIDNVADATAALNKLENGAEIVESFRNNSTMLIRLANEEELVRAWRTVRSYSDLRKDANILESAKKLLTNSKLSQSGLNEDLLTRLVQGNRGAGAEELQQLLKGYDELVTSGTKFVNAEKMADELGKVGNFGVGERWIQKYIVNNVSEFKGTTVTFEETLKAGENIRRVDVIMQDGTKARIYYEFKSVGTVPPEHFSAQFMNDLLNKDITDLSQIKWIFDGSKNPANFRQQMLNAIDDLPLKSDLAIKYFPYKDNVSVSDLRKLLKDNFDNIFIIK